MTDGAMHDEQHDIPDPTLDALLRRADPAARLTLPMAGLEARILERAAFPLAARRRDARSLADTLAGWVRVAVPIAAAAALVASLLLPRQSDGVLVADAELRESDPGALLSALDADGSAELAQHLIASDAVPTTDVEPR